MYFKWTDREVSSLLPKNWYQQVLEVAREYVVYRDLPRTPLTSRESEKVGLLRRGRVSGEIVREKLPWLFKAYHSTFLSLASEFTHEKIVCAEDIRYGVVLNVAEGNKMRFECHVDSNPLEGLLFCTDHPLGSGGELIVANNSDAKEVREVDADSAIIHPTSGHLIFFDARNHPHYVRPLSSKNSIRVVAAMNFYTESSPESMRPKEINNYLFGSEN